MTKAETAALWDRLYREQACAELEHRQIQIEMERIMWDVAEDIPLADGDYRRMKAGVEARAAFEEYERAMERFRAFVEKGIVPDDLKNQ